MGKIHPLVTGRIFPKEESQFSPAYHKPDGRLCVNKRVGDFDVGSRGGKDAGSILGARKGD